MARGIPFLVEGLLRRTSVKRRGTAKGAIHRGERIPEVGWTIAQFIG